ncbi:MAG TPA: DEAD/DEAH box helicase, partial [Armatimonadetes bacterium]|nr:DEAD/DEAH box helicase [Armatimonadota bacterium]
MPKSVWNSLLRELKSQDWYRGQITHIEVLPARGAIYSEPQIAIHHRVRTALQRAGIQRLYQHQADAIAAIRAGKHVAIITGASSGKTLCYNIPVLEALLTQREMRALYIFPTKALAQDQLRKLRELGLFEHIIAWTYDGDTPVSERRTVRETCPLIFTNPDMLHLAILPNHHLWRRFLANLRFVVLDELHTYHGIFGMHVASIIRRLRRLCKL